MKEIKADNSVYTCPLCGKKFTREEGRSRCAACLKTDCGVVCCPNCHYEFPAEDSSFVRWVRGIIGRGGKRDKGTTG